VKRESIVMALGALLVVFPFAASAKTVERTGYAYRMGGDELLYIEEHREWKRDGMVEKSTVTYKTPAGDVIATKDLDFTSDRTSPEFRLSNVVNGHLEGAKYKGDELVVFFRQTDDHELKEKTIQFPERAIVDGGFDRFIESNWQALLAGKIFRRPFLVPSFYRFVDFRIYRKERTDNEVVFVMEPASFLLRMVGDSVIVAYNRDDAFLRRYEGISNIRDEQGDNYEVRVEFPGAGGA